MASANIARFGTILRADERYASENAREDPASIAKNRTQDVQNRGQIVLLREARA